mgnify:FL=1
MTIEVFADFTKDLKQLSKKYKTIIEDVEVVKKVLFVNPNERPPFSYRIDNLGLETCIIKVKKIASKSFKGKGVHSGFRIIYAHYEDIDKIFLIEIYHKSIKIKEDKERIINNFK